MSESEFEKKQRWIELEDRLHKARRAHDHLTNQYGDGILLELFDAADQARLKQLAATAKQICIDLCQEADSLFRELSGKVETEE